MKRALNKDTFREIKKSFGRFLSIFAIVAIGVAFFAGVKSAAPDMKFTADKYYDDNNLMDIRVLSNLGLTDNDVAAIKNSKGVLGVYPTHSIDALINDGTSQFVFKVHGMPLGDLDDNNENYINRPTVVEGRLPEKSGECVLEKSLMSGLNLKVGDTFTLDSGTDEDILKNLKIKEYIIVGTVRTPYYLSIEKGNSSIGNGKVDSFLIIPEVDFNMDVYTEVLVTVNGAKKINSYNHKYFDITDPVVDSLKSLGDVMGPKRFQELKDEANKKLQDGKNKYNINKLEFDEEIAKAFKKLENGKNEIVVGEKELNTKENEFNLLMKNSEAQLKEGGAKLAAGRAEYEKNLDVLNKNKSLVEDQLKNPSLLSASKVELEAQLSVVKSQLSQLASLKAMLDSSSKELETQRATLIAGKAQGEKEIAAGRNKIAAGKTEMLKGEEEYNKSKVGGEEALAKASDEIKKGEAKIAEIAKPTWYVLDRTSHYSYVDYGGSADRIAAIAKVFPVFFFLVAALVCLTTMTRMVDEQRGTIGTLKALGYSKATIASKYIIYAAIASIAGSIVGFSIGMYVFPTVIFNAYGLMYSLPSFELKFDIYLALSTTALVVLITTSATLFACYKELIETPSLLMRPKAPKNGKRIFLERITFLWKRLSFTEKLTARNIFRYKKRFFMTVI
ncbi:MAG TPA: FtsX-like permease family protein, partial [Clostridium sp.]